MSHGDEADQLPAGFTRTAVTSNALAASPTKSAASGQCSFIPRSITRRFGPQLLRNFCLRHLRRARRLDARPTSLRPRWPGIREKVGAGHVICGLSGGVDSSVAAVLVHKAIGAQLTCVFVNNGVAVRGKPVAQGQQ